jgi:hypothetical protein
MKKQLIMATFLIVIVVTACGKHEVKFFGKWQKTTGDGPPTCEITENGEQYLVNDHVDGEMNAVLKDGRLLVGGGVITISYIQQSDHLIEIGMGHTNEYVRAK